MTRSVSRRSMLGMLGAMPLAGAALMAGPAAAAPEPDRAASEPDRAGPEPHRAAPEPDRGARRRDLRALDRFVAEQAAEDKFSGTVLVAHRGRPLLVCSHGMSNQDRETPNTPDTVFCLASVTKTFTALAIAQLVEQGRMGFHDPIGAHLGDFPAEIADTVTVHHLLTHTSGVGRPAVGSGPPTGLEWNSFEEVMDGTLAVIRQTPRQFAPGTRYTYSNDGYFVLAAIVARLAGESYFDYVRTHVFAAAGMSHTDFYSRPEVLADDRIARPYLTQPGGTRVDFATSPFAPFTIGGPAGGAYATASDLLAFARALRSGRLLTPAFTALITSGKVALLPSQPPSQTDFYGYGYRDAIVNGKRVFGHSGSGPGMATRLDVYPDLDWVSIVLSNYDTTIDPIVERARDVITS